MLKDGRHLPEMIMKSIALHIACFYPFGHLLGLQGHTSRNNRNMVLACLLFPSLPVVLLIRDVYDSVVSMAQAKLHRGTPATTWKNWEYYLLGALAMQAQAARSGQGLSRHILACNTPDIALAKTQQDCGWQ